MLGMMDGWYEDTTLCWRDNGYVCNCPSCIEEIEEIKNEDYYNEEN